MIWDKGEDTFQTFNFMHLNSINIIQLLYFGPRNLSDLINLFLLVTKILVPAIKIIEILKFPFRIEINQIIYRIKFFRKYFVKILYAIVHRPFNLKKKTLNISLE